MMVISEENLKLLIGNAFSKGVLSYNQWKGQPDTLWSNIDVDKEEYVNGQVKIIKSLELKINSDNE